MPTTITGYDTPLKNIMDGTVIKEPIFSETEKDEKGQPVITGQRELTARIVMARAVFGMRDNENAMSAEKRGQLFGLGVRIMEAGDSLELKDGEATEIKARVGAWFPPMIYGQVAKLLDV